VDVEGAHVLAYVCLPSLAPSQFVLLVHTGSSLSSYRRVACRFCFRVIAPSDLKALDCPGRVSTRPSSVPD
jgi:hypothetical protein